MFGLGAYEDIVFRETHDAFELDDFQHAHLDVDDAVGGHELLDLAAHGGVLLSDGDGQFSLLGRDQIGRHLIHAGNEREAGFVDAAAVALERIRIHQELGGDTIATDGTTDELLLGVVNYRWRGRVDAGWRTVAILIVDELAVDNAQTVFGGDGGSGVFDAGIKAVAVVGGDEGVMIHRGHGACGLLDALVLRHGVAAELLGEELRLHQSEAVLHGHNGTWFINAGWIVMAVLIGGVVFQNPCVGLLFSSGHELHQARIDALQRLLAERFLLGKNAAAFVRQVKNFADGFPGAVLRREESRSFSCDRVATYRTRFGVGLGGEGDGEALASELTEETLAAGVGPEVGGIQQMPVVGVAVVADVAHPAYVGCSLVAGDGFAVLIKFSPAHELLHVLYLQIVGLEGFDVAEKMFGQCAAVGIARLSALGPAEVGAFEGGPQHDIGIGIFGLHTVQMLHHRGEFQRSDVLGEVERVGMVGLMGEDGVTVVVHTGHHLGAFLAVNTGIFHTGRRASSATKKVDVK